MSSLKQIITVVPKKEWRRSKPLVLDAPLKFGKATHGRLMDQMEFEQCLHIVVVDAGGEPWRVTYKFERAEWIGSK